MTCRQLTSFIADYLSDDLNPETKDAFERHLTLCPNCVQYIADYKRAMELGRLVHENADGPATDVPETLIAAILAARGTSR